jgi:hypothetical protein
MGRLVLVMPSVGVSLGVLIKLHAPDGGVSLSEKETMLFADLWADLQENYTKQKGAYGYQPNDRGAMIVAAMMTPTYRVQVKGDGRVNVYSWGLAKDVEDTYDSVDALPTWMQHKIATLMIFDPEKVNSEIEGLGRRISKGTFWLYPSEGEDDGNDA